MLSLAAQLRGEGAGQEFTHFYCPMVPDGGGDWLQPGGALLNPYFGRQMLHCGEKVQVLPTEGEPVEPAEQPETGRAAPAGEGH
jgi:hypothetical protein